MSSNVYDTRADEPRPLTFHPAEVLAIKMATRAISYRWTVDIEPVEDGDEGAVLVQEDGEIAFGLMLEPGGVSLSRWYPGCVPEDIMCGPLEEALEAVLDEFGR